MIILEEGEFYIFECTSGGLKKTLLDKKISDKKYNKHYIFMNPLFYYNESSLLKDINDLHSKRLGVGNRICFFLWNYFHIWCPDVVAINKREWIGYEHIWFLFSKYCLTFKNDWNLSKPFWLFNSLEFDKVILPPNYKNIR